MKKQFKTSYYFLFCIIFTQLYATCETIDDFKQITFVLTGKTKKASLANGIAELTRRISLGDEAAIKCKAMLSGATMELQESTLNAYNAELQTLQARLLEGKKVALERGLDGNFKGTPSKAIAAADMKKLQADMDEEREQERQKHEEALAKIKEEVVTLVDKAAALSPLRRELAQERARERATPLKKQLSEAEAELKRLRSQMGCDVLATILEERPESADDGFAGGGFAGGGVNLDEVDPLKLELASYYGKIKGISKKLEKAAEITRDCNEIEELLKACLMLVVEKKITVGSKAKPVTIFEKDIPDDNLEKVLSLMKQACDIANNYRPIPFEGEEKQVKDGLKFITKWVDGHKEKMTRAKPKERIKFLEECFDLSYLGAIKDEKEAIDAIDTLQLSLDLTLNLEASILSTKKFNLYLPSAFVEIDRIITSAISNFQAEIIKQDSEHYASYLEVLKQEKDWAQPTTNFSLCPTILHLLRSPMVLFMFKRPAKKDEADNEITAPFASFGRILDEIRYLTENQKKALFASLYFVVFNYEEVSKEYLGNTLLSNTPIQPVDIHPLIKEIKESLKKNFQPLPFTPSTEQQDLAKFSVRVNDLLTGKTYREGVTNRFASALINLGQKLDGISQEGIVEYLQTENLPEEKRTKAGRILAEHEFISREALNQQLVTKQREVNTHRVSLEKSILEKTKIEAEVVAATLALDEETSAKTNAQREKKEKENEIEAFVATVPEHEDGYVLTPQDKVQLVVLGKKLEELEELDKKLRAHTKLCNDLDKESKKLVGQIARLTKQINSLEINVAAIEPAIENLAAKLREVHFVPELEQYPDDIERIASRGNELFGFDKMLDSCFALLTDLQANTRKLVEARTAAEATAIASASNQLSIVGKLGSEAKSKIEAVLLKANPEAHPQSAAAKAKKLKAMALVAVREKRDADELVAKPPARPLAFAAPVVSAESLEQELAQIATELEIKQIDESIRANFIERIQTIRGSIETAIPTAQMKINTLKREIKKL